MGHDPKSKPITKTDVDELVKALSVGISESMKGFVGEPLPEMLGLDAMLKKAEREGLGEIYFKLDENFKPISCGIEELEKTLSGEDKIMALSQWKQGVRVSSVFLGIDHGFKRGKEPIVFETMIFDEAQVLPEDLKDWQERNSSYEGILRNHKKAVMLVKEHLGEPSDYFVREPHAERKLKEKHAAQEFVQALKKL